jgi:hypothetical protein
MTHPHVRPWLVWPPFRRLRAAGPLMAGLLVGLTACVSDTPDGGDPFITPIGGDAGTNGDGASLCTSLEEGCVCEPGTAPLDCYLDPITVDDHITCRAGTRYCRGGLWTGCESVVDYELGGVGAPLLTGPTACNPCDPRCFGYVDRPGPGDLTAGNSSGVSYDPVGGGISLTPSAPVTPPLTDTDGDGIPDVADSCVGPGAFLDASGACYGDTFFYHMLPYGGAAVIDPLPIRIQIRTADIYFLMDTTGSMGGELARLQADLTTGFFHPTDTTCGNGVVGAIRCAIPDAWFGVGYFDDYPVGSYGGGSDLVFRNVRDIDASLANVQAGISSLGIHWGNDGPESNTQALWAVASGGGLGPHLTARTGCAAGRWGHPCFRDGTIPIVIHVTDAPFHNGPAIAPGGGYPYAFSWGAGATNVTANENFGSAHATGNVSAWAEYTGTTAGMTNDLGSPGCGSTNSPEAVFRFTVPGPAATTVNLSTAGSGFDTVLTLYREPATVVAAVAGNETFASAHVMTNGPHTLTGNTAGMANDLGNGSCGSSGAPEAVFQFTLPSAGTITATTVGSAYDAVLSLWQDVAGTPTYVTCNDDTFGVQSQIIASLAAGTYYIAVDGYASDSGAYQLNFSTSLAATFVTCNDNAVGVTSAISQSLAPGDYYAVVEGFGSASGAYRLGFGTGASAGPAAPVSWTDTINALNARDVRVITLQTCGSPGFWYCDEGTAHANALANGTGSVSGAGVPYVFLGAANGAGLSSAIVNAVVNLANYSRMDISARAVGDTQGFTQLPITATGWGPLGSCLSISGGTQFLGCLPGTQVNFNVSFRNNAVMPTAVAQVFDFFIEVVGDGTIILERIPVRIVVPPMVATYPATGNYLRDYDATARCAINERPIWGALRWDVPALPAGTSVRFELRTADTAAALPTATPMATVNVPAAGAGTADVTAVLTAAGALARQYHLRVNAVLNASADRLRAPVLSEVQVAYTCIPDE